MRGWERSAYASLWLVMLAPVLGQALARPLAAELGLSIDAPALTLASLLVALVIVAVPRGGWAVAGGAAVVGAGVLATLGSSVVVGGAALLAVAAAVHLMLPRVIAALPARLDGLAGEHRVATAAMFALGLAALIQTAMLATFMGDSTWLAGAHPLTPDLSLHACSTAYMRAIELALAGADNIYAAEHWPSLGGSTDASERYAPFDVDAYAYPPMFLVLMRPFAALTEFSAQRALWFGCNALVVALGLAVVAQWIAERDAVAGTRASLLALLVWLAPTAMITLQVGNVHLAVLVAAVVGMVCFERGRPALGGALLAAAILAKISPGLLGIVLLVRRQWRAALWTAGFGVAWTVAALLLFGLAPFEAFVSYELPRLSSGEALEFFANNPRDTLFNLAPFGVPFKLAYLGVRFEDPWASARTIAGVFNVFVLGFAIVAGLRDRADAPAWYRVCLWLAVLTLGGLRSPFAPAYVALGLTWLLCCSAHQLRGWRGGVWFVVVFVASIGLPPMPGAGMMMVGLGQQALVLGVVVYAILRVRPDVLD